MCKTCMILSGIVCDHSQVKGTDSKLQSNVAIMVE